MNFLETSGSMARGFVILTLLAFAAEGNRMDWDREEWTWLIVSAGILAFIAAYGIGANDVANAFATSVGAKAITVKQAVLFASVFEFCGAVLMGSSVSKTIRKGIADVSCFEDNPGLLIYGMTCVILAVSVWLLVASYLEMPVSTTHSTVGGIIGMTLMSRGKDCVVWNYTKKDYGNGNTNMGFDEFPWLDGVAEIAVSWLLSPIASGICAAILYAITKYGILVQKRSYLLARIFFPFIVAFTAGVNTTFWIVKGTKGRPKRFRTHRYVRESKNGALASTIEVAAIVAACCFGVALLLLIPISKWVEAECPDEPSAKAIEDDDDVEKDLAKDAEVKKGEVDDVELTIQDGSAKTLPVAPAEAQATGAVGYVTGELNKDPHAVLRQDSVVGNMHAHAARYDPKTEGFFRYVQVFTAMVDSFSHGANDVANAMGPFAAAYVAWKKGKVEKEHDLKDNMTWILALGGAGIVVGLATYGYKIMTAMGVKLAAVTPSRGYCIELGAAFVIIYGTAQGWPLSTTHCQVGATVAVGLFEGYEGVNGKLLAKTAFGWVITLVVVGLTTALLVGPSPEPLKDEYCGDWCLVDNRGGCA
mmetsp:Transcript_621/g.2450  ORF Transcript_621/g.2450 Transcript_621/m.2450 type:complete len:589 (+) Transcript_621:133-1899(+)|eukprot:CAMPEP_0185705500 /NCGR_PEP_ID=MMETSP1164-20130828/19992_1 /TAXON_ID=1104430 /ORGANISM="Chrysoreinhardia sp, Strain CCMP2950" /LENGTH=588 /DNA_ID=CAMNT_0028372885 /DNA_START=79 /DNA_END=1845 /DNA_ORIENTATION=+